ncbi:MAG: isoaspartyl peptidase/L-asparaginase [Gammaproteobacteria bacterium]
MSKIAFAIHGGAGAGVINEDNPKEQQRITARLEVLKTTLQNGWQALQQGKTAVDVVMQAVMALEDFEEFNAGRGSVLTSAGTVEMDASIMEGEQRRAGAVAAVRHVKNPIQAARIVMEHSPHVLMVNTGADTFCQQQGAATEALSYFITEHRQQQLRHAQQSGLVQDIEPLGTVGAVACDEYGNLAAATSTGGKINQLPGRVGDSPIIGAGTWADNNTCALSATGDGEILIRCAFAHRVHSALLYQTQNLHHACQHALAELGQLGGQAGCIAVDSKGNLAILFNTPGMYRAWIDSDGQWQVALM